MKSLEDLVKEGQESDQVLFRRGAYTNQSQVELLRDVLSLANANVDGPRFIILGAEAGIAGAMLSGIPRELIDSTHRYHALVRDYIEPPLDIWAKAFYVDGKQLVGLTLEGCEDKPYMMRADHSAHLRRGDTWIRVNKETQRMGRRQLETVFAERFAEPLFSGKVDIGFDGDMLTRERKVQTVDTSELPSKDARTKLETLIEAKEQAGTAASENTFITRLTHARLFGADKPYQSHSVDELRAELEKIEERYHDRDEYFRFVEKGEKLNLVIFNESNQEIQAASFALMVPRAPGFRLARRVPDNPAHDRTGRKVYDDESSYPTVTELKASCQVTQSLGTVMPGASVMAFKEPLRLFADKALEGKRVVIHYKLFGRNLRRPITGKLDLKLV